MNGLFSEKRRKLPPAFFAAAFFAFSLVSGGAGLFAIDYYLEGEELFRQNNPAEAIPLLYQASTQPDVNPNVFVYLGLCYQQEGKFSDAVETFLRGTAVPGADKKTLFFNAGNVYFSQKLFSQAEEMYTSAIQADSSYAPAFLNRANSRIMLQKLDEAAADYSIYLRLDPASWQREPITRIIALINQERVAREEAAARAEAERLAMEAERAAAEERFRLLMDEVNSTLQAVDGASVFSAGSENVMGYDEEGELE